MKIDENVLIELLVSDAFKYSRIYYEVCAL